MFPMGLRRTAEMSVVQRKAAPMLALHVVQVV
jgi:hypothetical protein